MASARVKVLLLILILGMPVLIYLFLQGFGENKYEIPVFYQDGLPDPKQDCSELKIPHRIDYLINKGPCKSWNCSLIEQKLVLFSFASSNCQHNLGEIARVGNLFKDQSKFKAVTLSLDSALSNNIMAPYFKQYPIAQNAWLWWSYSAETNLILECGFNLTQDCSSTQQAVLVDQDFQIRGYYLVNDAEELDRLVTEITILLKDKNS